MKAEQRTLLMLLLSPFLVVSSMGGTTSNLRRELQTLCSTDKDCLANEEYCAAGECVAMSFCKVDVDCFNPSNQYMSIDCVGYTECQEGACTKTCGTQCADGTDYVNCFAQPCAVDACDEQFVSCADNYCGGCNSIHFDAAGNQVCMGTAQEDTPVDSLDKTCTTDKDCNDPVAIERQIGVDGYYCAQGVCKEFGACDTLTDCRNPANKYAVISCEGYLECREGQCGMQCDSVAGPCRDGSEFVTCEANPCSAAKCEGAVSCVDDFCGECNALHFDMAGNQVCSGPGTFTGSVMDTCVTDTDCAEDAEYCATDGNCKAFSMCQEDADCENPSNVFDEDDCEGSLECQSNQCIKVCDEGEPSPSDSNDGSGSSLLSLTTAFGSIAALLSLVELSQ